MNQSNSRVVAVIPSLGKNKERLNSAIESIRNLTKFPNLKIVVVDNSKEGNLSELKLVDDVIWTGINLGNVGSIEYVRRNYNFDFLWTVQDDMLILNDVLGALLNELINDPKLGVVSPVLVRDGVIPAFTRGGIYTDEENIKWINIPEKDVEPELFIQNSNLCFVAGSGALWKREALEDISGFDLNLYPLVHGDVDTCIRLLKRNWKIKLLTTAHISHEIRGSTSEILGNTLHYLNEYIIRNKFLNKEVSKNKFKHTLDEEFLFTISKKSTYLFLQVALNAEEKLKKLEKEKSDLETDYANSLKIIKSYEKLTNSFVNSNSWKLTSPIRKLAKYLKNVPK